MSLRQSKKLSIILLNYALGMTGNTVSILSLSVLFITYVLNKELRIASKNILPVVSLILLANTATYYCTQKVNFSLCVTTAVILHWAYLSMILLTAALACKMYQTLGKPGIKTRQFDKKESTIRSITACFAVATTVVFICVILEFAGDIHAQYGKNVQWFCSRFSGKSIHICNTSDYRCYR